MIEREPKYAVPVNLYLRAIERSEGGDLGEETTTEIERLGIGKYGVRLSTPLVFGFLFSRHHLLLLSINTKSNIIYSISFSFSKKQQILLTTQFQTKLIKDVSTLFKRGCHKISTASNR